MVRGSLHPVPNGSLYLITGCDKAPEASCIALPGIPSRSGVQVNLHYKRDNPQPWSNSDPALILSCTKEEEPGAQYGVFVRGIRISLNHRIWVRNLSPETRSHYNLLCTPISGGLSSIAREIERRFGPWPTNMRGRSRVIVFLSSRDVADRVSKGTLSRIRHSSANYPPRCESANGTSLKRTDSSPLSPQLQKLSL